MCNSVYTILTLCPRNKNKSKFIKFSVCSTLDIIYCTELTLFEFSDQIRSVNRPLYFSQHFVDHFFQSAKDYYCTMYHRYAAISVHFHILIRRYLFCQCIHCILATKPAANCTVGYGKPIGFRIKYFDQIHILLSLCWCCKMNKNSFVRNEHDYNHRSSRRVNTYWYRAILMPSWTSWADGLKNFGPLILLPKKIQPPMQPQRIASKPVFHKNHKRLWRLSWSFRKLQNTKKN